jgi:hypothetical protein
VIESHQEPSVTPTQEPQVDVGVLEANIASQAFGKTISKIAVEIHNTVKTISPLVDRFDEITKKITPGSTKRAQTIAEQIASELDRRTGRVKGYLPELSESMNTSLGVFIGHLTELNPNSEKSKGELTKYRLTFNGLSESLPEAIKTICSLRDSISNVGSRSGIIMPASRQNVEAIGGVITGMERLEAFRQRIVQICDEKLNDNE